MISAQKLQGMLKAGGAKVKGETDRTGAKRAAKAKTPDPVDVSPFSYCFRASLPPSANHHHGLMIRKTARGKAYPARYVTGAAKAWKETFQNLAKIAGARNPKWGLIRVTVYIMAEAEELDVDNGNKLLLDALKHLVYHDDKQVRRLEIIGMGRPPGDESHIIVHITRYHPEEIKIPQFSGATLK